MDVVTPYDPPSFKGNLRYIFQEFDFVAKFPKSSELHQRCTFYYNSNIPISKS